MRRLFIIIAINFHLYSCALCALYTPTAHISFSKNSVIWEFSANFTKTLLDAYDDNFNEILDPNELETIKYPLLDYLIPREFLTELSFYNKNDEISKKIDFKTKNIKLSFNDNKLYLKYDLIYDFSPSLNKVLVLKMQDNEGFFNFKFLANTYHEKDFVVDENINQFVVYYEYKPLEYTKQIIQNHSKEELKANYFVQNLANLQDKLISFIKTNNILLYPVAFIYGFFHALLPSHGKSITAAYFMNSRRKIAIFSLKVGLMHLLTAFVIASVFSMFDLLKIGKISGFLIALLAMILLYLKLKKPKLITLNQANKPSNIKSFKKAKTSSVLNITTKEKALDNALAFSIGLLPCPGLILVIGLISSFSARAFVAAILIALGMSFAIFLSAFIITRFRFSKKIEILSLIFVIILGLFLGFNG